MLGLTPVTLRLLASLAPAGLDRAVQAIYAPQAGDPRWFHLHGTGVFYRQETGR